MTRPDNPQHARPTEAGFQPTGPEPSYAERARTLVYLGRVGTLSTISKRHPGWPFGSVMPYGLDEQGCPTFLISTMAMHTQNLLREARASLLVTESGVEKDPLGAGRVTLMGQVRKPNADALDSVKERYIASYPNASYWVDFKDFAFFRMEIEDIYFVGGFGVMGWVAAKDFLKTEPDPLADAASDIIAHMNKDHVQALLLLSRGIAGVEGTAAKMTAVDRLGFHLRVTTSEGMRGLRIPFDHESRTAEETRKVLVDMVRKHREMKT